MSALDVIEAEMAAAAERLAADHAAAYERKIAAGAKLYDRARILPRLLPYLPVSASADEIVAALGSAVRAERARGEARHWTFSYNRLIGLEQALRAERNALPVAAAA